MGQCRPQASWQVSGQKPGFPAPPQGSQGQGGSFVSQPPDLVYYQEIPLRFRLESIGFFEFPSMAPVHSLFLSPDVVPTLSLRYLLKNQSGHHTSLLNTRDGSFSHLE